MHCHDVTSIVRQLWCETVRRTSVSPARPPASMFHGRTGVATRSDVQVSEM